MIDVPLVHVVILANPADDRVLVGVKLAERVHRASALAGVSADHIHTVTSTAELADIRTKLADTVIVVRGTTQVVMTTFMEAMVGHGSAIAWDASRDRYADAIRVDSDGIDPLWAALAADFDGGDASHAATIPTKIEIAAVDRHPARGPEEHREASRWIFQFVNKPLLDAPVTKYIYRPIARPFTRLFVRLPVSPNQVTIVAIILGQLGCIIAAGASYHAQLLGIFIMSFPSAILDNVDGEVARLRLQSSRTGAWMDAVGDDIMRVTLLIAIGIHVAPQFPDLPIMIISAASTVACVISMVLMYWYSVVVVGSPNTQNYADNALPLGTQRTTTQRAVDALVRTGAMISRRDFVDLSMFIIAVFDVSIVAVVMFCIGNVASLAAIVPAHLKTVRERAARRAQ